VPYCLYETGAPPPDEADAVPALRADHPLLGLGYAKPLLNRTLTRLDGDSASPGSAMVAEEVPVSLVYNMRPHVVMMATPADLEDFAVGFTLTEGIVTSVAEISRVEPVRHAQGIEVQIDIQDASADQLKSRGRSLIGRTGCGLCGVESIQDAVRDLQRRAGPPISSRRSGPPNANSPGSSLGGRPEACAAVWVSPGGTPDVVRETWATTRSTR
jgi:hypothetical protein